MFPDMDRILYLDGDTLIFKDLTELFNISFNNNYILGYPCHTVDAANIFSENITNYVNVGVLLFNIKQIRKNNLDLDLLSFTMNNNKKSRHSEQATLNYIFNGKIGLLPLKYGIYLYGNIHLAKKYYLKHLRMKVNYTELDNAILVPSIVHLCCCKPKVWKKGTKHKLDYNKVCNIYQKEFYFYAHKTKYYNIIYNKYMK